MKRHTCTECGAPILQEPEWFFGRSFCNTDCLNDFLDKEESSAEPTNLEILPCGHTADYWSNQLDRCEKCEWEWIEESEAPLREVESGRAMEKHLDYLSSFDDPRSF